MTNSLLSRCVRHTLLACAIAIAGGVGTPRIALAQETISSEVWLGSTLFTIEDLENLADAAQLNQDQKDAALELMRGGMARARTISLKTYRAMDDWGEEEMGDEANAMKRMEEWQGRQKKQAEEVVEIEKSIMNDLKALLEPAQVEEGWPKFERSRRRLLLQSIDEVQRGIQMAGREAGDFGHFAWDGDMMRGVPDLVAAVRAAKLKDADLASIATLLDQYAKNMDALIIEYRTAAKPLLNGSMGFSYSAEEKISEGDAGRIKDAVQRMRTTHIRAARQVDDALKGDARDRFMRQRLKAEFTWEWQPSKRQPQIRAILRLRSLSKDQKEKINQMVKEADATLMRLAGDTLRKRDEDTLADKKDEKKNPWEYVQDKDSQERMKKEQKVRKQLVKDAVALLSDKQQAAYQTGIEDEQDLADAFEKRRHGANPWGVDQDLMGWADMYNQSADDEDEPKK